MKKQLIYFLFISVLLIGCQQEAQQKWVPKNLLEYGIPMTILSPDSVDVKTMDLGPIKDVTIKSAEAYSIQIYASRAETTDVSRIKSNKLAEVKANPYFSKIIKEEEDGFIYEAIIDSSNINYDFRYIRVQGDMEFIFQTDLIKMFTQEEAEAMYGAVKQNKK